jgi:hypothetical protein
MELYVEQYMTVSLYTYEAVRKRHTFNFCFYHEKKNDTEGKFFYMLTFSTHVGHFPLENMEKANG